jgi:tetratricopeptide (TPR) repeat protein
MPYEKNPHFTGRDDLFAILGNKLRDTTSKKYNHRVAIYGMGGVGKTQLAIEYVYRNQTKYHSIFWVSSADQAALLSGFQDIARATQCVSNLDSTSVNPTEVAKAVLSWLRTHQGWLLVLDNLDDIDVATGFLPDMAKGGHTLITTRNPHHLTIPAEGLQIPILGEEAAIQLLLLRCQIDCSDESPERIHAAEIVKELGCLALAIEQAAAFIRSSVDGIPKFVSVYRKSRRQFHERNLPKSHPYPNSVAATFLLSFNRVNDDVHHGTQAISLLRLLAFLNPDGILIDFVRSGSQGLDDTLRQIIEDEIVFHDSLELLQRYSLVALSQKRDNIVIHRLVQAVIKDHLDETQLRTYRENVLSICNFGFPEVDNTLTMAERMECRRLQNQVLEPAVEAAAFSETNSFLLYKIGRFLYNDAKFRDSERVFGLWVDLSTKRASEEHEDTLTAMIWLAEALKFSGKLDQAAAMGEKILEVRNQIMGGEHPDTLNAMDRLGVTLRLQGNFDRAAAMVEKVLEARKRIQGEEHPETLQSMGNLALILLLQGKWDQAAAIEEKVLEAKKRILGDEHIDTLVSMGNLADILKRQGKEDQAAAIEEKVLEARKRILGDEHPSTLIAMDNIASTLWHQGKVDQAAAMYEKVLEAKKRILGDEHPSTLIVMGNLASTLWLQGKVDQAAAMEKVMAVMKRILGERHPDTLTTMNNLALSYNSLGRRQEAIQVLQEAVDGSRTVLGENHPDTRSRVALLNEWLGKLNSP